jgi:hypothetical protein
LQEESAESVSKKMPRRSDPSTSITPRVGRDAGR